MNEKVDIFMNERLDKLKTFLREFIPKVAWGVRDDRIQMFRTRCVFPDTMERIYYADDIKVDFCPGWVYLEIFGLTDDEYAEVFSEFGY